MQFNLKMILNNIYLAVLLLVCIELSIAIDKNDQVVPCVLLQECPTLYKLTENFRAIGFDESEVRNAIKDRLCGLEKAVPRVLCDSEQLTESEEVIWSTSSIIH